MADIAIPIQTRGDRNCGDKKKRKHRHRGSGLLKFSGLAPTSEIGSTIVSFLADPGTHTVAQSASDNYPVADDRRIRNLAVNLQEYTVILGGSVLVELLKNGFVKMSLAYGSGETGVKVLHKDNLEYETGDVLDLRVTTAGITDTDGVNLSATIGLEADD